MEYKVLVIAILIRHLAVMIACETEQRERERKTKEKLLVKSLH